MLIAVTTWNATLSQHRALRQLVRKQGFGWALGLACLACGDVDPSQMQAAPGRTQAAATASMATTSSNPTSGSGDGAEVALPQGGEPNPAAVEQPQACTGANTCQRYNWPRLIVGVLPKTPSSPMLTGGDLRATGLRPDGSPSEASAGDIEECPHSVELASSVVCTSQWYLGEGRATVVVYVGGGKEWAIEVDIAAHNYCGIDVRYLLLEVDEDRNVEVLENSLRSPCQLFIPDA